MQTLSLANARKDLGGWLDKVLAGQKIGVIVGGKIVALQPLHDGAADYAETEYGLTSAEADRATAGIRRAASSAAKRGETVAFRPGMLAGASRANQTLSNRRKKAVR